MSLNLRPERPIALTATRSGQDQPALHPLARTLVFCFSLLVAQAGAAQSPQESPAELLITLCIGCHANNGVPVSPEIPYLYGQNESYLYDTLQNFKSGQRRSEIMEPLTRELKSSELRALALHFSTQPYIRQPQHVDLTKAARGQLAYQRVCMICHLDEGRASSYTETPLLAGQSLPYMLKEIAAILDGTRPVDITKRGMLALLSPAQIEDALHFFAGQRVHPDQVRPLAGSPPKRSRKPRAVNEIPSSR